MAIRTVKPAAAKSNAKPKAAAPAAKPSPKPSPRPAPAPTPPHAAAIATAPAEAPAVRRGPGRPSKADLEARAAAIANTPAPSNGMAPARPMAPGSLTAAEAATLRGKIDELTETIVGLNATIAKMKDKELQNVRTTEEILDGADKGIDEDDWRLRFHGRTANLYDPVFDPKTGAFTGADDSLVMPFLLSLPRMTDPGPDGSAARARKMLAAWNVQREDGTWEGPPHYISNEGDLATLWAPEQPEE